MGGRLWVQDRKRFRETRAIQDVDVYRLIARLRIRTNIPDREVLAIYHDFERSINTEEQLLEVRANPPPPVAGTPHGADPLCGGVEAIVFSRPIVFVLLARESGRPIPGRRGALPPVGPSAPVDRRAL